MTEQKTRTRLELEIAQGEGYYNIPHHMWDAIELYVERKIAPGSFLEAVICNDLRGAVGKADHINQSKLKDYIGFFYNHTPSNCWGSPEMFLAWINPKEEAA